MVSTSKYGPEAPGEHKQHHDCAKTLQQSTDAAIPRGVAASRPIARKPFLKSWSSLSPLFSPRLPALQLQENSPPLPRTAEPSA